MPSCPASSTIRAGVGSSRGSQPSAGQTVEEAHERYVGFISTRSLICLRGGRGRRVLSGAGRGAQHHRAIDRGLRQPRMGGVIAYFLRKRLQRHDFLAARHPARSRRLSSDAASASSADASRTEAACAAGRCFAPVLSPRAFGRSRLSPSRLAAKTPNCRPNFTEGIGIAGERREGHDDPLSDLVEAERHGEEVVFDLQAPKLVLKHDREFFRDSACGANPAPRPPVQRS